MDTKNGKYREKREEFTLKLVILGERLLPRYSSYYFIFILVFLTEESKI